MNKIKICLPGMLPRILVGTLVMLPGTVWGFAFGIYLVDPTIFGGETFLSELVLWQRICLGLSMGGAIMFAQYAGVMAIKKYMSPKQ